MKGCKQNSILLNKSKGYFCWANVGISASLANASAAMFQMPNLKQVETCADMATDAKHFILFPEREMFVVNIRFKIFHHVM